MRKVLALLLPAELRRGAFVLLLTFALALVEAAGVASVMPFLAVLGNRDLVHSNPGLLWAYERGGFSTADSFLFALGLSAFTIVVGSCVFRIQATYAVNRYTQRQAYLISARLLEGYLRQPYEFFLDRNSADLSKSILSETDELFRRVLLPGMNLLAHSFSALVIIALLVWVDPLLAAAVATAIGAAYGLIYLGVRKLLGVTGQDRLKANRQRFTTASEAFGGIKDLKVLGRENAYLDRFRDPADRFARHQALSTTLQVVPKYLIEAVGFGGVLAMALVLMRTSPDLGSVLPVLGLYTFAAYRLLPSAQRVYAGLSSIRFGFPGVTAIHADLVRIAPTTSEPRPDSRHLFRALQDGIRLESVTYLYPGAESPALTAVDVQIPAGTCVGVVGSTGSGKTTAMDLILGLLQPTTGRVLVDGIAITLDNVRAWQACVGYVPQTIFLADASIAENIAFGVAAPEIDRHAVARAAALANIHEFVVNHLPAGYDTEVGERGVRLSGGQRQRLGIARALYRDPAVLVLDEATSALDSATERAIMEAVVSLAREKTIIIVAHRISTIKACDAILVIDSGRVIGCGTYSELQATNEVFRSLSAV